MTEDNFSRSAIPTADHRIAATQTPKALDMKEMRARLDIKSRQKTPLTTMGFEGYVSAKEPNEISAKLPDKVKFYHACGPIPKHSQMVAASFLEPEKQYPDDVVANWTPHMSLAVFDHETQKPLSAAAISQKMNDQQQRFVPHYFVNPMQDLDYIVIEAMLRFTFIGSLIDGLTKFTVGKHFRPELEMINPSNDPDKDKATIESEGPEVIETLMQIDNQINQSGDDNFIDSSFMEKISALINVTDGYNRSALIFGYDKPVEVNGKAYKQIPSSLKFAHARDLGIIDADPGTWRLKAVQWRNAYYMVPSKDMIYLWNPLISAKTRNSWLYGDSLVMPMLDAARTIRKNIGVNFNAMAEATWAGMFVMAIKPKGESTAEKQNEYSQIANNLVRGGPSILLEDPHDVSFNSIDFAPKVLEFVSMTESLLKYCVATTGMPHSMWYDEDSSNRATMIGKIQLAEATVIEPRRAWIGRAISDQWYQRWFRLLYKDSKPELYKKYKIKMKFSNLNIAEWFDKIQAVNELDSRKQLTDVAYGELAGLDNYTQMVEKDAETTPGGSGAGQKMDLGNGNSLHMKKDKNFQQPKPGQKAVKASTTESTKIRERNVAAKERIADTLDKLVKKK